MGLNFFTNQGDNTLYNKEREIIQLAQKYTTKIKHQLKKEIAPIEPRISMSETLI